MPPIFSCSPEVQGLTHSHVSIRRGMGAPSQMGFPVHFPLSRPQKGYPQKSSTHMRLVCVFLFCKGVSICFLFLLRCAGLYFPRLFGFQANLQKNLCLERTGRTAWHNIIPEDPESGAVCSQFSVPAPLPRFLWSLASSPWVLMLQFLPGPWCSARIGATSSQERALIDLLSDFLCIRHQSHTPLRHFRAGSITSEAQICFRAG